MALRLHRSRETDPYERGRAFGRALRGEVQGTLHAYGRLLGEAAGLDRASLLGAGARVREAIEPRWPDLVRELAGVADAAFEPLELLLAVNARTELMAGAAGGSAGSAGECSLVASVEDGCTLAQTWDWHPALAPSRVVHVVEQPGGRWFATLTEAGVLAKIGLSSRGIACALNFLNCSADGGLGGVPIHVLARVTLDRCDDESEALELLRQAPVTASSCITIGWRDGVAAVELSPGGARVVREAASGRLVHTNHFLAPPAVGHDTELESQSATRARAARLAALLAARGLAPVEHLLRSHAGAPHSVCRHDDRRAPWPERRATLAAVVLEPGARRMRVADGPPCRASFREVPLPSVAVAR